MDPNDPMAALMFRKAQLLAQEQAAMGSSPGTMPGTAMPGMQPLAQGQGSPYPGSMPPAGAGLMQPTMPQSQFSGYPVQQSQQQMPGRPPMTPQQVQQLAALLQARQQ